MPKAKANDIEIEYETFGNTSNKPLLLINGLGSQLINWDENLVLTPHIASQSIENQSAAATMIAKKISDYLKINK